MTLHRQGSDWWRNNWMCLCTVQRASEQNVASVEGGGNETRREQT